MLELEKTKIDIKSLKTNDKLLLFNYLKDLLIAEYEDGIIDSYNETVFLFENKQILPESADELFDRLSI